MVKKTIKDKLLLVTFFFLVSNNSTAFELLNEGRLVREIISDEYKSKYVFLDLKDIYNLADCKEYNYQCVSDRLSVSIMYMEFDNPESMALSISNIRFAVDYYKDNMEICPDYLDYSLARFYINSKNKYNSRFTSEEFSIWILSRLNKYLNENDSDRVDYKYCAENSTSIRKSIRELYCTNFEC
ncbi:hypothetical protein [Amphritea pacifica]|uniref:Sel1 repeat family protein n=1 Tax=Amphritea pacifica TaxID=2811233 RepID=A0ABS2WDF2_9GAMM|nr:hypothetical protein [Amphritea pacifica]MBN0989638.1 hypothetical protein [Amphritea pacifica]